MSEKLYNQPIPTDPSKWKRSMAAIIGSLGQQGILEASDIDSKGKFIAERLSQKEFFKNEANQTLLHNLENYQLKTGKLLNQAKRTQSIGPVNPAEIAATPVLRVMVAGNEYAQIKDGQLTPPSQPLTPTPSKPVPIENLRFTRQALRPIGLEQDPKPKQNNTQKLNPPPFLERLKKPAKFAIAGLAASLAMALGIGKALPAFTAPLESAPFASPTPELPSPGEIPLVSKDAFFKALKKLNPPPDVEHAMTVLATPHGREANPNEAFQSGYDPEAGAVLLEAHRALQSMYDKTALTALNIEGFLGSYNSHKDAFGSQGDLIRTVSLRMHEGFDAQTKNDSEIPPVSEKEFSSWLEGMRLGPETKQVAQVLASEGGRFSGKSAALIQELIARYEDRALPTDLEQNPTLLIQMKGALNSFTTASPNDRPSQLTEQTVAAVTGTTPNSTESGPKPKIKFERFTHGAKRPSTISDVQIMLKDYGYSNSAQEQILRALYSPNPDLDAYVGSDGSQLTEALITAARNGIILDEPQVMYIIGAIKENSKNIRNGKYLPFYPLIEKILGQISIYGMIKPEDRLS